MAKKNIFISPSIALKESLVILAAITELDSTNSMVAFIGRAIDNHLDTICLSDCKPPARGYKREVVTVTVDLDAFLRVDTKARIFRKGRATVVLACAAKEALGAIARWGCETPEEFVLLMRSSNPLKIIERKISVHQHSSKDGNQIPESYSNCA